MTGADFAIEISSKLVCVLWALAFALSLCTAVGGWLLRSLIFGLLGIGGVYLWSQLAPEISQARWLYCALGVAALSLVLRQIAKARGKQFAPSDILSAIICSLCFVTAAWGTASLAPQKSSDMTTLIAANFGSIAITCSTALVLALLTTLKSSPSALAVDSDGADRSSTNSRESKKLNNDKSAQDSTEAATSNCTHRNFWHCRWIAGVAFCVQVVVAMNVFFGDAPSDTLTPSERRPEYLMLAWMYSTTLLTLIGTVVYVAGRVLSKSKPIQVKDWTALTLASWLAVFALGVAIYLPLHWPWAIGSTGPANASISAAP